MSSTWVYHNPQGPLVGNYYVFSKTNGKRKFLGVYKTRAAADRRMAKAERRAA